MYTHLRSQNQGKNSTSPSEVIFCGQLRSNVLIGCPDMQNTHSDRVVSQGSGGLFSWIAATSTLPMKDGTLFKKDIVSSSRIYASTPNDLKN